MVDGLAPSHRLSSHQGRCGVDLVLWERWLFAGANEAKSPEQLSVEDGPEMSA